MRSVETLGILMPPSVTSGSGISCGGQRTRDRMLQEGQQTQSMVPAFSWAAFFLNIACSLGHGRVQSETTTCQPFSMQTPAGLEVYNIEEDGVCRPLSFCHLNDAERPL
ncbi:uncharacterized protein LOC119401432 isoform X11 [Rhipicephalus sanguineus]|uniref:uncharacterized protein LOC119401432 isoform X11 n=1 Tax=Rhipicephalus sanguineus TaxID=34632 RepID=UPI0018959261|nr:uncharacterized protein LOC119401432 isoform X11 [Rhipicephalus sanguineus]